MLTFTLDTNCLIALEENRPEALHVCALLNRHAAGTALVQLVVTTAAENRQDGAAPDIASFQARLKAAGLDHLPILKPVLIWDDLTYWGWAVWGDDSSGDELRAIHEVLFPASPYLLDESVIRAPVGEEQVKAKRKWRNQRLDGLGLHTHIRAKADVYVTSDANFVKQVKRAQLAQLGAPIILSPAEAEAYAATHS